MKIGGYDVRKGEKLRGRIKVLKLANQCEVTIPILILNGAEEGPVFWINGAVHGDELNGSVGAKNVFERLDPKEVRGTLVVTPIANPLAFQNKQKHSFMDHLDMDQMFPGDPTGLPTQRIAYHLFGLIRENADYLLSLHSNGTAFRAKPYIVYKRVPNTPAEVFRKIEEMALTFGLKANCCVDIGSAKGELPGVTAGALDITCIQNGIPAFMLEAGRGGRIQNENVKIAETGILNTMKLLNMVSGDIRKPEEKQIVITKRMFFRSDYAGMSQVFGEPGSFMKKGETIARVFDWVEGEHMIKAPEDMYIICSRCHTVVDEGDRLAFVGTEWRDR